jgi:hypothetical protein
VWGTIKQLTDYWYKVKVDRQQLSSYRGNKSAARFSIQK